MIDDDVLGVSAGFAVRPNGDEWHGSTRRIRKVLLDHVALVDQAAYPDARVAAVRSSTPSRTPNLDTARALLAAS